MKKALMIGIMAGCLPALTGCSLLSAVKLDTITRYTVERSAGTPVMEQATGKSIIVLRTKSAPGYDSQSMIYRKRAYQLDAFAKNEWVAPPPQMIANVLERSLEKTHAFKGVVSANFVGETDYSVDSTLLRLDQDFSHQPNTVELGLSVQVIDNRSRTVIASEVFHASMPTTQADPYGGVLAANAASEKLMKEVCAFVLRHTLH